MTEEELNNEIVRVIMQNRELGAVSHLGKTVPELRELFKQANYVHLADDQSLPENPYPQDYQSSNGDFFDAVEKSQQDMLKVQEINGKKYAFRKVEIE